MSVPRMFYQSNPRLSQRIKGAKLMVSQALFSKKTDDWSTPPEFYNLLNNEFNFDYDPCPLRADFDGLALEWHGNVYVNPPYSDVRAWLEKGIKEIEKGNSSCIVYLLPARTCTKWFHDLVYGKAELRFVKGRLKFGGAGWNAPFPNMVAIYRKEV